MFTPNEAVQQLELTAIEIINCTPHDINVYSGEELVATFSPAGFTIRVAQRSAHIGNLNLGSLKIPVFMNEYGEVENLPPPKEGVFYVVSALTAQAAKERKDLLVPGDPVRDPAGRIIGCRGFCRV